MTKIDTLEPDFREKVILFIARLKQEGIEVVAASGRRTMAEQNALYAQGRTKPGSIVTRAKGGSSPHNFGLAVDVCPVKNGKLDWNAPDALWKKIADIGIDMGFIAGYYFRSIKDAPHFEDPNWKAIQALWRAGKITVS